MRGDGIKRPREEAARQRAIRSVDLDAARPAFERIARTAQRLARTPVAHISLAEVDRMWIAGVADRPEGFIPREGSAVNFVIESDEVMWVEDLRKDHRFDGHPHVYGERAYRFYAAAPIVVADGARIGVLAVIDRTPHAFDPQLAAALEDLAALAAQEWDRNRAMRALTATEARARATNSILATVIESAPVALVMTDRKLRIIETSRRWRIERGMAGRDVRGLHLYDVFPYVRERWGRYFDRALTGETIRSPKTRLRGFDGSAPWARTEITAWRGRRGRIGGLLIMTHDISDMIEALEASRRSEQSLKLALEIGELSMWELDHRDQRVNSAGTTVVEASERDYAGMVQHIWDGVHPHDRPAAMEAWERYEAEGVPFRATFRIMQRNGPHVWVHAATEVVRDAEGHVERTVGVLRNIDKQKRSEMALAKAKEAAEAANRAKSEFLANMSHEIRTPLNGVMGVASALARTGLDANQREMVGLIETSARTLEALLSDVLDLARVESGRLALAHEPFDLARCIADAAELFQPSAEGKGLDLILDIDPGVDGVYLGDAARVRQILSNLLSNAVKFTSKGHIRIVGAALMTPDGIEARISVKDTGIGFDEETKARLFGRFEQADGSITRRYGGSGLGLAISRQLADLMGGGLDAASAPGAGAAFTLTLPLVRSARASDIAAASAPPREAAVAVDRPLRVLLAED
ncbi:MAG TPA: ATP-binding protein, partial [Caulobacteraceae bacterium]|nr:ATP-binding protein [Caulobacteraceae bacterium]